MAKEKKVKINEKNLVNKAFKEYIIVYLMSSLDELNNEYCDLIFDAIEIVINNNISNFKEEGLLDDKDCVELRLYVNIIKELIFISQQFELETLIENKRAEKIIGHQLKRLKDENMNILEFSKVVSMLRNIVLVRADFFMEALFLEYNIVEVEQKDIFNNLLKILAVCNEVVAIYILFEEFKPKNYLIDRFKVKNGKLLAKYSTKKLAPDSILKTYEKSKNLKLLKLELFRHWANSDNINLKLMNNVCEAYVQYSYWGNNTPEVVHLEDKIILPFIEKTDIAGDYDGYNMQFKNNLHRIVSGKRYAMPKNGCILTFKKPNSSFVKAKVSLENNVYMFEVFLRENTYKNSEGSYAKKIFLGLHKNDIKGMIECDTNNLDDILRSPYMVNRYIKSSEIVFPKHTNFKLMNSMINSWMLGCLYCIFIDISNTDIEISNIEKTNNGVQAGKTYSKYKTAHIRKLPDGYKASEEARDRARKMDILLEEGYTFVREYIPSEDNSVRKLTIKN